MTFTQYPYRDWSFPILMGHFGPRADGSKWQSTQSAEQ